MSGLTDTLGSGPRETLQPGGCNANPPRKGITLGRHLGVTGGVATRHDKRGRVTLSGSRGAGSGA